LADNQVRGPVSKALIDEFSREQAQIHDIASML
jgi:hypothetical protein